MTKKLIIMYPIQIYDNYSLIEEKQMENKEPYAVNISFTNLKERVKGKITLYKINQVNPITQL